MKYLARFFALPFGGRKIQSHNDNLRAGQHEHSAVFSPWAALVSFH